jgi:PKD repeat protein
MKKTSTFFTKLFFTAFFALVLGASAQAQCSAGFTFVVNGNNVTFTNTSTGFGNNVTWTWSFGDTQTAGTMNATHTYSAAGTYTVCLGGVDLSTFCVDTACHVVTITSSGIHENSSANGSIGNYPNPFANQTTIGYTLKETGSINISVFDVLGNNVAVIENNASKAPGSYETVYDGSSLSEGVYFLKLTLNGRSSTSKITISR